ncbi:hypothetical protein HDU99_001060 [Rhizoclosmatium hyalinum]|nr:hypothetical protein HDU99_001060 [Rhizoclosmatium hyalinum]
MGDREKEPLAPDKERHDDNEAIGSRSARILQLARATMSAYEESGPVSARQLHVAAASTPLVAFWLTVLLVVGLLSLGVLDSVVNSGVRWLGRDSFVVAALLAAALAFNAALVRREWRLAKTELQNRLKSVLDGLELASRGLGDTLGLGKFQADNHLPTNIASVTVARVLIDGSICYAPFNLLLEGDIVQLAFGDKAPAKAHYCNSDGVLNTRIPAILEKGQLLKPATFNIDASALQSESRSTRGQFYIKLLETPLVDTVHSILHSKRPDSVIYHQLYIITATLTTRVIWFILGASFIINVFRYAFNSSSKEKRGEEAISLLFNLPLYAVLPLLPLSLPFITLVARSFGNAQIICLHEALQASKEDFKDEENIDEFDAAPPPTKEVQTDYKAIWTAFVSQIMNRPSTPHHSHNHNAAGTPSHFNSGLLSRTTNLVESLASATVICAIDREGTVSMPFPTIDSLFFLQDGGAEDCTPALAPAAVNNTAMAMNANILGEMNETPNGSLVASNVVGAGVTVGNGVPGAVVNGLVAGNQSTPTSTAAVAVTGFGNIAAAAAAEPVVLDLKEEGSATFGLRFEDKDWRDHMGSLKPLGLSLLLSTSCASPVSANGGAGIVSDGIGGDTVASTKQRRLKRVRTENHRKPNVFCIDGRVKPARQTCLCRVGREIGFQDSVVESFSSITAVHWYSPKIESLLTSGGSNGRSSDYHFEVPSSNSQIFLDTLTGDCQVFSDGNVELIVESCVDYWNGSDLELMTDAVEKKIFEFYQNAVYNDMQVIAYSYRPIPSSNTAQTLTTKTAAYVERNASFDLPKNNEEDEQLRSEMAGSVRWKNKSSRIASIIDSPLYADSLEPDAYLREVLRCQTFLGMAALCYEPKQDISNVIEDLKLAGIRFVYFSEAPERESKAYAERLGLEIDWNSCIILSSSDGSPGYLELHDMKAQLPRGVENIRGHIERVDDVPLRVSLFAESSPYSVLEMIKIFQENGEVVCCIGSSLNETNVESFATADISVAIDPFVALKTKRGENDPLAPLVLGAGVTTSPCALRFYFDTSVYSLTQLIREARTLVVNAQQGFSFHFGCQMSLSGIMLVSYIFLLPPILTGYQLLWLMWVIFPLQSIGFLFTPHDSAIMTMMPVKNNDHLKDRWRSARYYATRFAMPTIGSVAVFILSLWHFMGDQSDWKSVFGSFGTVSWMRLSDAELSALLYAQHILLVYFVLAIVTASSTFLSRTRTVWELPPWKNRSWMIVSVITIVLQLTFSAISLYTGPTAAVTLNALPWHIIFVICFGIVINIPIQEVVKRYDKQNWVKSQKLAQLQFNTKLGMHSPL